MKAIVRTVAAACVAFCTSQAVFDEVTLNSVRVAAADTPALARFYQAAFGMQEVNRIEVPGGPRSS